MFPLTLHCAFTRPDSMALDYQKFPKLTIYYQQLHVLHTPLGSIDYEDNKSCGAKRNSIHIGGNFSGSLHFANGCSGRSVLLLFWQCDLPYSCH